MLWPRPGRPVRTFTEEEREWLAAWCRRQDAVLGVREGAVDSVGSHTQTLAPYGAWSLSGRNVPDPSAVLRVADAVLTDDADETVDFLLTGRPLLHLLPGTDDPAGSGDPAEPVAHYPPATSLPGPVCTSFEQLAAALEVVFEDPDADRRGVYARAVALAFAHTDDLSGWRVVERIRRQYVDG